MASRGKYAKHNQMYVADFETCDGEMVEGEDVPRQRVWLAGLKNIETMETKYFTSLDDFMAEVLSRGDNLNREYAFHNLKFDGSFIIPWLFKNGFEVTQDKPVKGQFSVLIDDRNNWYSINIQVTSKRRVTFWDSLKLFPTPLEYLHQTYGTPTKKIHEDDEFYNTVRGEDHTPTSRELEYLENDLQVLAETIREHINFYGLRFKKTQAGQSFYNFEQHFKAWRLRFPPLNEEVDKDIRKAYWGGISHVNPKLQGKDLHGIEVYDINSSYPYQLAYNKLPYGGVISKTGEGVAPDMSKFWVAQALVRFKLKDGCLPCIPKKAVVEPIPQTNDKWLSDSNGIAKIRFCIIDYMNMADSYDFEIVRWDWVYHWAWKVQKEIQSFILKNNHDKVYYKKLSKETNDPNLKREYLAKSQRAKIDNNSFYGKFGEDIIKLGKTPYFEDDNVFYRVDREELQSEGKRKFLPVAIATTAWGRRQLVKKANLLGEYFIYCDTDSVHFLAEGKHIIEKAVKEGELEVDPTKLGAWDREGYFDRGRFLRAKCYYEEVLGESPEVTLAGLPADPHSGARSKKRSCITWDNFHIGLRLDPSVTNKLGTKRTPTGNKLVPVGFEIVEEEPIYF